MPKERTGRWMQLFKNIATVGFWTFLSRILGMFRDILLLAFFGVGPVLDAFIVAFRLPNMFRRFFAEGALSSAFVPMYSKKLADPNKASAFAGEVLSGLTVLLLFFTGLGMIFMPILIWITAVGFTNGVRFELAVEYGRVMFPYIFLVSLAALISGILNAHGKFAVAAAAPIFLNVIIIVALLGAWALGFDKAFLLVWSIPLAGIVQLLLLWWEAQKSDLKLKLVWPQLSSDIRKMVKIAIPAALANGVVQINLLIGTIVASFFPGAVSWLYSADRLYQLPVGLVGVSVSIVLLPELSKRLKVDDRPGARLAFSRASEISFALSVPATVALLVIPLPLVTAIFQHGAATQEDSQAIALACVIYSLGLPAFILQKILQPLYFAQHDTETPFRFAIIAMLTNLALAVGLMGPFGWLAPAVAVTFSAWVMAGLLVGGTRKFGEIAKISALSQSRMTRLGFSAIGMGAVLWAVDRLFNPLFDLNISHISYGICLIILGISVYLFFACVSGVVSWHDIRRAVD